MIMESWLPRKKSRLGRGGYRSSALFLAYLLKIRENIPHYTVLSRKLEENVTYREFCDFRRGIIPSHDTLSRFFRNLTPDRLDKLFNRLDALLASSDVFDRDDLAIDATEVLSNSQNKHKPDP
ncbi:MAG: transposase [Candidatus Hodarchaeales archaeon]